ncbi:MAG: galactose oxidase early set domain-containing protein, partial [Actinomycetota bacterium]|nr:galactose oxidase early set domain-containing protein [Actinomycetota bacterium]
MRPEPGHEADDSGGGRWYPSLVTLATGQVLAMSGHPMADDTRHYNNTPERYLPALNTWLSLPAFGNEMIESYYPRLHLLPDGDVFVSSAIAQLSKNVRYDPWTGAVTEVSDLPNGAYHGFDLPAVLLPLLPGDGYQPRVLLCGEVPQKINLADATPAWKVAGDRHGSAAGKLRLNSCAVILPTGAVLLTGGVEVENPEVGVKTPEIYDPAIDWSTSEGSYRSDDPGANTPNRWDTIEDESGEVRNYHSTALLMPDGRVWTGGSSRNASPGHPGNSILQMEVFTPEYPAGARPTITACPRHVAYGREFDVESPQAGDIRRIALIRCGAVTHDFDSDQRYVALDFTREGNVLHVTAPPHGGVAPPGYYMLFLVDDGGRPCERASFVRVGGDMYLVTDRSFFSEMEVQVLGSPARFYDAFYLVFDDYLPSEVGLSPGPAVTFEWADGGGTVPDVHEELVDALFENGSAVPDVAQRISLVYAIRFDSAAAFAQLGPSDERGVSIVARHGSVETRAHVTLFKKKNPFVLDGDPHWLSVDLRVKQMTPGQVFAGTVHGPESDPGAPTAFAQQVIANLNARPEDDQHPFLDLSLSQEESPLELATHRGDTAVYNYAFAKVRLRAPANASATDVRVFFRLFTTAATSLEFNPTTSYRRAGDGPDAAPLLGLVGGAISSIPFFASDRVPNMATQTDPSNRQTLTGQDVAYFGCWLDFNQETPRFPRNPGTGTGPFAGELWSIQNLIRGLHQCLVAEVHYVDTPIPFGAPPAGTDKLAQRNLVVVESSNPVATGSHIVTHTFEIRPSAAAQTQTPVAFEAGHVHGAFSKRGRPDELLIRFYDLPRDSVVTLYLPEVNVDEIVRIASLRNGPGMLRRVDDDTIQCLVGDAAYVPIPGGREDNIPGLLTVELPPGVTQGQTYRITVHQISSPEGQIIGSFQLTIPVAHGADLLDQEKHRFAVLSHIKASIPQGDRWRRVFDRYVGLVGDRVRGFGGDPDDVKPSPAGTGGGTRKPVDGGREPWSSFSPCCLLAWAVAALLAGGIFLLGIQEEDWVWPARVLAAAGLAGGFAALLCRCKASFCDVLRVVAAGAAGGAAALALVLLAAEEDATSLLPNQYVHEVMSVAAVIAALLLLAASAGAQDPELPPSQTEAPPFFERTGNEVERIAGRASKVREARRDGPLDPTAYTKGVGRWQVSFFRDRGEEVQVQVDDRSGAVLEQWSGDQVAWTMARGYAGAFGRKLNAPYVWIPLCVLFLAPFFDPRRPFRLLHLDLLVLVAFGASHVFFNRGEIGLSAPLVYPVLLYLLVRLLAAGFRPRERRERLVPIVPVAWLAIATVLLVGFRVGLNVVDSNVIDVGYAGVLGADRIADGRELYGAGFSAEIERGDTYGPVNYLAYVPFEQALPWGGSWDDLPAAHGAAIAFDLATLLGLVVLGRRLRPGREGRDLGTALGFAWAAYPYGLFSL